MGTDIDQEHFGERDYARFAERLEECLTVLGQLLNRPGFGAGVAAAEADQLLDITARAASGQTGAAWQRATLAAAERRHDRQRALAIMLDCYLHCAGIGLPVHTWPVGSPAR
jgi:hypothetical protein